jgi:hypothetical protein
VTIAPVRPTEEATSEVPIQVLIEEARQHRRRRLALWLVATIVIASVTVGIVAGHNSGRGGLTRVTLRPGVPNPAFTGPFSKTQSEMLAYVLPTSGADITTGGKFMDRIAGLVVEDKAACMDQAGYNSTVTYTPGSFAVGNNTQFPPIAELSANGFVLRAVNEPYYGVKYIGKALSKSAIAKHTSTRTQCGTSAQSPVNALLAQTQPLSSAWQGQIIPSINRTSAFKKALVGWSSCVSQGGVAATSIDGYFQATSLLMRGATSNAALAKNYLKYGKLYATCLAPAESIRDQMRQKARTVFEHAHASQIASLTNTLRGLVS